MSLNLRNMAALGATECTPALRQVPRIVAESPVIEQEESIRAYWMIEMLDSMTSLGSYNSQLTLKLPPAACLPCSESTWSRREPFIERFTHVQMPYFVSVSCSYCRNWEPYTTF